MNVLFIGAHADDIEILFGGTLFKCRERGDNIYMIIATNGNIGSGVISSKEEIAAIRAAEAREAAAFAGAQLMQLDFDDERLINNEESRDALLNAIRWANPDLIFTHCPEDKSPDHHNLSQIIQDIILSVPVKLLKTEYPPCDKKISLFFGETTACIGFMPEVYVDISDHIDQKCQMLACHKSQDEWMGNYMEDDLTELPRVMARLRGAQVDVKYAEAFRAFRIHGFMPDFKLLP